MPRNWVGSKGTEGNGEVGTRKVGVQARNVKTERTKRVDRDYPLTPVDQTAFCNATVRFDLYTFDKQRSR